MQQSSQLKMISIITGIVVIVILGTIIFQSRGIILQTTSNVFSGKTKVAIITSDVVIDQSWGSLAYKGMLKIEEQYPVNVTFYSEIDKEKEMKATISEAINAGSKLIIGHGREFSDTFTAAAKKHKNVHFITIHGSSKYSNQSVYTFDQGEVEYFAALSAVLATKTNKVGLIDANYAREKNPEFETALTHYNPEIEFFYEAVGSRDDGITATKIFKKLIEQGVDVVYSKGNSFNRDIIDLAKKEGIYVIGYLDDQSYMAKNLVLTSVTNDVPQAYVSIMEDYFSSKGIPQGKVLLTKEDGVYSLAPFGPIFSNEDIKFIENEMKQYDNGELIFP
ncbi:BMP family ABC transporter substrate-binding protein [Metabacillus litoralis]|uniref:BMP family ABC transporter substrate-binding protein n=1 Tax=Metabacillus litoralis TaxID=152268 RepID=A0A5C6W0M4_9BACI|nr:BMP family ABC transporter substrate-binding protein [Metabacillus litoralis]TXC89315.1 BMP family ABC transporter substrate-binding protein [Metabacillus litoralis]